MYKKYIITFQKIDDLKKLDFSILKNNLLNYLKQVEKIEEWVANYKSKSFDIQKDLFNIVLKSLQKPDTYDAQYIIDNFFPNVNADIFICHAHHDYNLALFLAKILDEELGIKVFIDSLFWSDYRDLVNFFLKKYQVPADKYLEIFSSFQSMLTNSLLKMIDDTECFIFINFNNSLNSDSSQLLQQTTHSQWIFSEINFSNAVKQRIPERITSLINERKDHFAIYNKISFEYPVVFNEFEQISWLKLWKWINYCQKENLKSKTALDVLYNEKFLKS